MLRLLSVKAARGKDKELKIYIFASEWEDLPSYSTCQVEV